jgi:transcriptional regulator with XRE-family HTH domain
VNDLILAARYKRAMDRIGPRKPIRWFLREWRKHRRLTLQQVAARLDTSPSVLSDLENGKSRMNDDWIAGFAWAYQVEPSDLLRDPAMPTRDELLSMGTPEQLRAAMSLIKTMKTGTDGQ